MTLHRKGKEKAGRESKSWFCFEKLLVLWISLCNSTALWGRTECLMRLRAEIVHKSGREDSGWFVTCFAYLVRSGVEMLLIFCFWGVGGGVADWRVRVFYLVASALWTGVCLANNLCIILWVVTAFSHSRSDGSVLQGTEKMMSNCDKRTVSLIKLTFHGLVCSDLSIFSLQYPCPLQPPVFHKICRNVIVLHSLQSVKFGLVQSVR